MKSYELRNELNELVNTIVLDDLSQWLVPAGHTLVELPESEPTPQPPQPLTQLEFLRRFTAQERITIRASTDPVIIDFMHLVNLAQDIRLDDSDTVAGTQYLEQQGLIGEGRAAEILTP